MVLHLESCHMKSGKEINQWLISLLWITCLFFCIIVIWMIVEVQGISASVVTAEAGSQNFTMETIEKPVCVASKERLCSSGNLQCTAAANTLSHSKNLGRTIYRSDLLLNEATSCRKHHLIPWLKTWSIIQSEDVTLFYFPHSQSTYVVHPFDVASLFCL